MDFKTWALFPFQWAAVKFWEQVEKRYTVERLDLEYKNRMWRMGRGYNDERPFFRIDWKTRAWRFTPKQ